MALSKEESEILASLSDMERKYCENRVLHQKSRKDALVAAGSKTKNPTNVAHQMEQKERVQLYQEFLKKRIAEDLNIQSSEIIYQCRRFIEQAYDKGRPKDAEGYLRMMAELGGHLNSQQQQSNNQQQINVNTHVGGNQQYEDIEGDSSKVDRLMAFKRKFNRPLANEKAEDAPVEHDPTPQEH